MGGKNNQQRYLGLQALRAIAALLVVIQHAGYFSGLATGSDTLGFRHLQLGLREGRASGEREAQRARAGEDPQRRRVHSFSPS